MTFNLTDALMSLRPGAEFVIRGDVIETYQHSDPQPTATLSADMRTYRQALRDLPANTSDPANPTWPTKP